MVYRQDQQCAACELGSADKAAEEMENVQVEAIPIQQAPCHPDSAGLAPTKIAPKPAQIAGRIATPDKLQRHI